MRILVLNGPNLSRLGKREPAIYGSETLAQIENRLFETAEKNGVELVCLQSEIEGEMVKIIHDHADFDGMILNAAAYTHTSVALRDAIAAVGIETVEVHISNIYKREEFRHRSYISAVCAGGIFGLGSRGYDLALQYFLSKR